MEKAWDRWLVANQPTLRKVGWRSGIIPRKLSNRSIIFMY